MAFVISDRIKESSTGTGTGTLTLAGAVTGFATFAAVGNANTCTYVIIGVDANGVPTGEWETGIGTYTSSGTTLSRGVIKSSNSNALVNFSAGTKHVICTDVAGYATPLVMATTANRAIQVADQTALSSTAGNARGSGAVDLQIKRATASSVASGTSSTIAGGSNNTASNTEATVGGGSYNSISAIRGAIAGGRSNSVTGGYGAIGGGKGNLASNYQTTIGGGSYNTASGYESTVSGGYRNTASGKHSFIGGGARAVANKHGQSARAAGRFAADGDAQTSQFVLRKQTTNGTQAEMFLDNSAAQMTLSNDTTWIFNGLIVARRTDTDGDNSAWKFEGCIRRNTNAASTGLVAAVVPTQITFEGMITWTVDVTADTTNGALRIRVTGEASKTINWVAVVNTVETTG